MVQIESQSKSESESQSIEHNYDRAEFLASVALADTDLRRRLSMNVRTHRQAAHLTLKVVAERAGVHWRHWQKIEAGQVNATLQTLVRVADALNVDPISLLQSPPAPASSPPG